MKKVLILVLIIMLLLSTNGFSISNINVMIDEEQVSFNEQSGNPFLDRNGRTQVPLRITMESFGANVEWNNENKIATVAKNNTIVKIPIGEKYITVDNKQIATDTEAIIKDGKTYLPIRVVAESLGAKVFWDSDTQSVVLSTNKTNMYVVEGIGEYVGYRWLKGHKLQEEIDIYYQKDGQYLYSSWKIKKEVKMDEKISWTDWDGNKKTSTRQELYSFLDSCVKESRLFAMENSKYLSFGLSNPYNDKMQFIMENIPKVYNDWANAGTARETDITSIINEYENGF